MKVFRRERALVLCMSYALLLVLTMLNLLDYKWHKEPLQQCSPDGSRWVPGRGRLRAAGGAQDLLQPCRPAHTPAWIPGPRTARPSPQSGSSGSRGRGGGHSLQVMAVGAAGTGRRWCTCSPRGAQARPSSASSSAEPRSVLPLRAGVACVAETVPGGRRLPARGSAGHAERSLPLRPLGLPAVQPRRQWGRNLTTLGIFGAATNKVVCSSPRYALRKEVVGLVDDACASATPQRLALRGGVASTARWLSRVFGSSTWRYWRTVAEPGPETSRSFIWCGTPRCGQLTHSLAPRSHP